MNNVTSNVSEAITEIEAVFKQAYPNKGFTDVFRETSLPHFFDNLPTQTIVDAMDIAVAKKLRTPEDTIRYFCGICWIRIRNNKGMIQDVT